MPIDAYEEARDRNIRSNIEKLKSSGVYDAKHLLNKLSTRKKNDYRIVARKKKFSEESALDYEPSADENNESEESETNLEEEEEMTVMNKSSRSKVEPLILFNFSVCTVCS